MKNSRKEKPVSKFLYCSYKKALYAQFGSSTGITIYNIFEKRFKELLFDRSVYTNTALNCHLTKNILPGIALYDALLHSGLSTKDALYSMRLLYEIMYKKTKFTYRLLGNVPFFFHLLRRITIRSMSITYPKDGWTTTWLENSSKKIAFDVSRCFYQDVLKKYGHEELLACFCQIDDYVYENMSRKVQWKRSTTLGRCGTLCDFQFIAKESEHEK